MVFIPDDPLASIGVRRAHELSRAASWQATRPLVLRSLQPAPDCGVPEYVYDPQRQIATDPTGALFGLCMDKDWASIEGTRQDGYEGDNEAYGWEEVPSQ